MVKSEKLLGELIYNIGCKIAHDELKFSNSTNVIQGRLLKQLGKTILAEDASYKEFIESNDDILTDVARQMNINEMVRVLTGNLWQIVIKTEFH